LLGARRRDHREGNAQQDRGEGEEREVGGCRKIEHELATRERRVGGNHVDRKHAAAGGGGGLGVEPAFGGNEEARAAEARERPQQRPPRRVEVEGMTENGRGDERREGGKGADMARALDQPMTQESARRVAREISRGDEPGDDRLEVRSAEADADQRADVTIGKLDQADGQDEGSYSGEDGGHVVSRSSDAEADAIRRKAVEAAAYWARVTGGGVQEPSVIAAFGQ
jgi:hypothetical protein